MKVINNENHGVIVINSKLTKEAILKLAKHQPSALVLKNEEGAEYFRIGFGENAQISKYGIAFNKADNIDGTAFLVLVKTMTNEEIAEDYAAILMKLKAVEAQAEEAYGKLEDLLTSVTESIETIGTGEAE